MIIYFSKGISGCMQAQFNIFSDSADLLDTNKQYTPSHNGIVNVVIDNQIEATAALKDSIINAVSVYQLNVDCIRGCDAVSIYPPIRNKSEIDHSQWVEQISVFRYSVWEQVTGPSWDTIPKVQIYAPFGIENANIDCGPELDNNCRTAVFCGIDELDTCLIEGGNDVNECEKRCRNITKHYHGDIRSVYISDLNSGSNSENNVIIYIPIFNPVPNPLPFPMPVTNLPMDEYKPIWIDCDGFKSCNVICIDHGGYTVTNQHYSCFNSTIHGASTTNLVIQSSHFQNMNVYGGNETFIFKAGFYSENSINNNNYYLQDVQFWSEFHCENECFQNESVYIGELNSLMVYVLQLVPSYQSAATNTIIYADMVLNESKYSLPDQWSFDCGQSRDCDVEIQFINIRCDTIKYNLDQCENTITYQPTAKTEGPTPSPTIPPTTAFPTEISISPTASPMFSPS